jgi:hypothetical protein
MMSCELNAPFEFSGLVAQPVNIKKEIRAKPRRFIGERIPLL